MSAGAVTLKDPFASGKTHSQDKLKAYAKAYSGLREQILVEDRDYSTKQVEKLKQIMESLRDIKSKTATAKAACQKKLIDLKKQSAGYEKKISEHEVQFIATNHEAEFKKKIDSDQQVHLGNCRRRVELAKSIDPKVLKKLDLDERKSEANELFKWVIVTFYLEPETKYYWDDFKEKAIQHDNAADLLERLGKIDALRAREEQRVKTAKFLDQIETVKKCRQFKGFQELLEKMQEIAKLFLNSAQIGRKIKDLEKKIEQSRSSFSKADEENLQNITNNKALVDVIRITEAYHKQLGEIEAAVAKKLSGEYENEIKMGETYIADLQRIPAYVSESPEKKTLSLPNADESSEKRQNCECTLY